MAVRAYRNRGSQLWDFFLHFVSARALFLNVYTRYERRVLRAAREGGVDRMELVLPPRALWALFHLPRLEHLRDQRLAPMRELAFKIFGDRGDEGLLDAYCAHILAEVSILTEEHLSVGRFVKHHDPRRYRDLFAEVSGYYPTRLRRVRRFFTNASKRLDELMPIWCEERVVKRSAYLFGERIARRAYGRGQHALYERMYPEGGAIRGFLEAARSFEKSGFLAQAGRALGQAADRAEVISSRRELLATEVEALDAVRTMMARLLGGPGKPIVATR